jgi:hypothetical protein
MSFSADGKMYFSVRYQVQVNGIWESSLYRSTFKDGVFSKPANISQLINTAKCKKGYLPYIAPDEKYLFFTRYDENWNEDIYWVDAKIIEDLKPEKLK